jgi:hypothetical protein
MVGANRAMRDNPSPRWLWLAVPFAVLLVAKSLSLFAAIIAGYLRIHYDFWFEVGMVIGQVLFQWLMLGRRGWTARSEYALLVISVSTLGAALLIPLLAWNHVVPVHPGTATAYFFGVVFIMFLCHRRLVRWRQLPTYLSFTWIAYRIPILLYVVRWSALGS